MIFWRLSEKRIRSVIKEEINSSIEQHLEKAIEKGVINALNSFGVDSKNMQEVQKDFHYLRKMRTRSEQTGNSLIKAIISIGIASGAVALWQGVKSTLKQ